jgi:hypothetical protein
MTDPTHTLRLSSGQYLDSNGNFHTRPPARLPTYDSPGGLFPIDFGSISKGLDSTEASLADFTNVDAQGNFTNSFAKDLVVNGLNPDALKALGSIASVAKALALATGVIGVAFDIASSLFNLSGDPNASLKVYMDKLFADTDRLITGVEMTNRKLYLQGMQTDIDQALVKLNEYQKEANNYSLTPEAWQARITDLRARTDSVYNAVVNLANSTPWNLSYDPANYLLDLLKFLPQDSPIPYNHWSYDHLYTNSGPAGSPGSDELYTMPPNGAQVFDHRLMVPWVTYAVGSYLTLIQWLLPEYRTTGTRQEELRVLASLVDDLATEMRGNLVRIIYKAADFAYVFTFPSDPMMPGTNRYVLVAGARDMCAQDNNYFANEWSKRLWPTGMYGNLEVDFSPPAVLGSARDEPYWRPATAPALVVTNPDECASATNRMADDQYGVLLMTSGHLGLLQLSALLRQLSSEPIRSETVGGYATGVTIFQQSQETSAYSDPILFVPGDGVIRAVAKLVSQQYQTLARLTTQPLGRDDVVEYRIVLRTLRWLGSTAPYDDYYETFYVRDPNPDLPSQIDNSAEEVALGYYRVDSHREGTVLISEQPITGWMSSPPLDSTPITGRATLSADTFDLYVASPTIMENIGRLRSVGWSEAMFVSDRSQQQGSEQTGSAPSQGERTIIQAESPVTEPNLGGLSGVAFSTGASTDATAAFGGNEPRHIRREQIDVAYNVDWRGDLLDIRMTADPAQRNYALFLVIEEDLHPRNPNSTQLHTAYRIEVNSQTTIVPQSFFDDEKSALKRAADTLIDFGRRHIELAPRGGPGDPIVNALHQGDLYSAEGQQRLGQLAEQSDQGLFREVARDHGVQM